MPDRRPASLSLVATAVAGCVAMAVAMGLGRFAYTPILPAMMEELGFSAAQAGVIASANYLGYLIGAILAIYGWADGRERVVALAALLLTVILLFAMALAGSLIGFSLIRFLAGLASAFVMIFTSSIVLSVARASGKPYLQWAHFGGVGIGIAASALIVWLVGMVGGNWQTDWLSIGMLGLFGFLAVSLLLARHPQGEQSGASGSAAPDGQNSVSAARLRQRLFANVRFTRLPRKQESADGDLAPVSADEVAVRRYQDRPRSTENRREPPLIWSPGLVAITLAYGVFGFGYIVTATFLVAIVRSFEGGPSFEMLVWLLTGLVAAFSIMAWSPLATAFGPIRVMAVGCVVEAFGVAASVLLALPAGPLVGGVLLGATFMMVTAYGLQAGSMLAAASPRRAFAVMTAAFGTGQIVGPLAAGIVVDETGTYMAASLMAAAALIVAGILAMLAWRTSHDVLAGVARQT